LYEALIKELTKTIVQNDIETKNKIVLMIKEHFGGNGILAKELQLYKALCDLGEVSPITAEKIIYEAKQEYKSLDKKEIFKEQSHLIDKINKTLSKDVFSNFVPSYKNLATIAQIFSDETSLKKRILLEESLFKGVKKEESTKEMVPVDNLVYKTFVKKFNDKYEEGLLNEQKNLLSKYITSFSNDGLEFRVFLNEELERLKTVVTESLSSEEINGDQEMTYSTKKVLDIIEGFKKQEINPDMLRKILKIQDLTSEIETNG
jgi:hypothetical protein